MLGSLLVTLLFAGDDLQAQPAVPVGFVPHAVLVGDRLGYVHIGENHRSYLGSGHLDFGASFHTLADIDYRGPITFESFSSAVVSPTLSNDLSIWRNLWDDGSALAAHAHTYLTDSLDAVHAQH